MNGRRWCRRRRRRRRAWQYLVAPAWFFLAAVAADDRVKGALEVSQLCYKQVVQATGVVLTCDSPGAYYYGSATYRNSEVCMSNDKANLKVYVTISSDYQGSAVYMTVESGLYNHYTTVMESYPICNAVTGDNAYRCPRPSAYTMKTYFTMPSIRDYSFHYTPDIRLTFFDADTGYRLGCATTGTMAAHKRADSRAARGMVVLGVSCCAFVILFAVLIYLSYRRKKRIERIREAKQYNYFRTLPTGQVVSLPGQQGAVLTTAPSATSDASDSALNITNPSYNTTQMPTRPII